MSIVEENLNILFNKRGSLRFKEINEILSTLNIDKNNEDLIRKVSKELSNDKRKNVISLGVKLKNKLNKYLKEFERVQNMYLFDKSFGEYNYVAGVDEVGRGPLAGPIVSAAVVLNLKDSEDIILEINDSKKLNEKKRNYLSDLIKEKAISYNIALLDNQEIDKKGIAYCNNKIFIEACNGLSVNPDLVLSDGYIIKHFNILNKSVIKGDAKSASIACASIIAKVYRDNIMKEYSKEYPGYDFAQNVGYGTQKHIEAIKEIGATKIHRMSFLQNILSK